MVFYSHFLKIEIIAGITASAKKLSLKKPTVDSDDSSHESDDSSHESDDSSHESDDSSHESDDSSHESDDSSHESDDSSHESDDSSHESDDSASSSSSDTKSTASDSSTGGSHSTDVEDSLDQCEGYRIIDLPSLEQVLGKAAMCCRCQGELQIEESSSARQGLASHLQICCTRCDSRHTVTYPLATSSVKEKELNQRAVLASRLIGRGRSAMRKFFSVLNMSGYMSSRTYEKYSRWLCVAADEAYASMKIAGEEVVRLHRETHR